MWPLVDPKNSDMTSCLSESPACHELSLSESPPKIFVGLSGLAKGGPSPISKHNFVRLLPILWSFSFYISVIHEVFRLTF